MQQAGYLIVQFRSRIACCADKLYSAKAMPTREPSARFGDKKPESCRPRALVSALNSGTCSPGATARRGADRAHGCVSVGWAMGGCPRWSPGL